MINFSRHLYISAFATRLTAILHHQGIIAAWPEERRENMKYLLFLAFLGNVICAPLSQLSQLTQTKLENLKQQYVSKEKLLPGGAFDDDEDESFYRLIHNVTEGYMFNISNTAHKFIKVFEAENPDLDPVDFVPFNCDTSYPRPPEPATSVHKLTPYDVNVVAAMGDSITAAFGALSFTLGT